MIFLLKKGGFLDKPRKKEREGRETLSSTTRKGRGSRNLKGAPWP